MFAKIIAEQNLTEEPGPDFSAQPTRTCRTRHLRASAAPSRTRPSCQSRVCRPAPGRQVDPPSVCNLGEGLSRGRRGRRLARRDLEIEGALQSVPDSTASQGLGKVARP